MRVSAPAIFAAAERLWLLSQAAQLPGLTTATTILFQNADLPIPKLRREHSD